MKRLGLVYLLLFTLAVASCSSSDAAADEEPSAVEDSDAPEDLAFDDDDESAGETAEPLLEEIRIALAKPGRGLPSATSLGEQEAVILADLLYDGLTEVAMSPVEADPEAEGELFGSEPELETELRPALALSWSANDDLTEWTFVLDAGRTDAETVAAHFAVLRQEARGPVAAAIEHIESVQADGAGQVRFELSRPDAAFAWLLSGVAFSIVGEQGALTSRYELTADDEDEMILGSLVDGAPDVVLVWQDTPREAYNLLTLGTVDAAVGPPDAMVDARSRFGGAVVPRGVSRYYGINVESPRLADERLRQAILHAVDGDRIVDEVLAAPAFAVDGVLASNLAGYGDSGCGLVCRHDQDAARELVDDVLAGGEALVEVRIAVRDGDLAVASAIARDLDAVGFDAIVEEYETDQLADVISAGNAELFAFGSVAVAGSIDAVVPATFGSDSPANAARVDSTSVDSLLEAAASTADDVERWALLNDAHEEALGEGNLLPLAIAQSYFVAAPQVQGVAVRPDGSLELSVGE